MRSTAALIDAADRMTLNGTVNKTGILLLCAIATAAWTWHLFLPEHDMAAVAPLMMLGADRRIHLRHGHRLQEGVVAGDSAHLRAARRPGARRLVGDA